MPILGANSSGGTKPSTPVIGSATDGGTGTTVSVAFTPSTYIGKGTITYTATSSPGSLTGTGSGSPITVSGLTTGTAYTFTVKGDTNYGVASDSSAASNSVTPASPSSFESIATVTASGGETSLSFTSIPGTYKSLQIRGMYLDTQTASNAGEQLFIRYNSDSGSNYNYHTLYGDGTSVTADNGATTYVRVKQAGVRTGPSSQTTTYGSFVFDLIDYASTSKYKTSKAFSGANNNSTSTAFQVALDSGLWRSTSAVTSITLLPGSDTFATGTKFALYGIKGS